MNCIICKTSITVHEGTTFDQTYQWFSGDPAVAVDLTGYTGMFSILSKKGAATALIVTGPTEDSWEVDGPSGVYFDLTVLGTYRIYLNDTDTAKLLTNHSDICGVYELLLASPYGETVFKQYGRCKIYGRSFR